MCSKKAEEFKLKRKKEKGILFHSCMVSKKISQVPSNLNKKGLQNSKKLVKKNRGVSPERPKKV